MILRQKWSRGQVEARFAKMPPVAANHGTLEYLWYELGLILGLDVGLVHFPFRQSQPRAHSPERSILEPSQAPHAAARTPARMSFSVAFLPQGMFQF